MIEELFNFAIESAQGIVIGILLLVVGLVFLPDKIAIPMIKKIKPDLGSRSMLIGRARSVINFLLNKQEIVVGDSEPNEILKREKRIVKLMEEKRLLESNLFFLDLLKNLSGMLSFSLASTGEFGYRFGGIIQGSMSYLQYYSKQLTVTKTRPNQRQSVKRAAHTLEEIASEALMFLGSPDSDDKIKAASISLKQGMSHFDDYMKTEYESAFEDLKNINQLLANELVEYVSS